MRKWVLGILILSGMVAQVGRAEEAQSFARGEKLPMVAWGGIPAEHATPERFREMADVGFTRTVAYTADVDVMMKVLDAGSAAGIKQIVNVPAFDTDPEAVVKRLKEHPAIAGYYLRDEPSATAFAALAELCRRVQAIDPVHPCYINLLPTYATAEQLGTPDYPTHLRQFVAQVPTPMLSYDHYPVVRSGADAASDVVRADFFNNLEVASKVARESNRPLWTFVLTASHVPYPPPTTAHLRYQAYCNLAYGTAALQFFTYWTVVGNIETGNEAIIGVGQRRTPTYERVKALIAELQAVRGAFVGSRLVSVGHTGKNLPAGTKACAPAAPISSVELSGEGGVVSLLSKTDQQFLLVVNRSLHQPQRASIRLDGSRRVSSAEKDGRLTSITGNEWSRELEPGDAAILTWTVSD